MERKITFAPAYDRRDPDPRKSCGTHGVEICFYLIGKHGAVQFVLYTNWHLPHVTKEQLARSNGADSEQIGWRFLPDPANLGYHSRTKTEYGYHNETCDILDGAECWYDESGLAANDVFDRLLREGDAGVWAELEDYYVRTFGELE